MREVAFSEEALLSGTRVRSRRNIIFVAGSGIVQVRSAVAFLMESDCRGGGVCDGRLGRQDVDRASFFRRLIRRLINLHHHSRVLRRHQRLPAFRATHSRK